MSVDRKLIEESRDPQVVYDLIIFLASSAIFRGLGASRDYVAEAYALLVTDLSILAFLNL